MTDKANPKELTKKIKSLEKRASQINLGLQNLKESENQYRQIINSLPVAIFELDFKSLKFTDANDTMCEYSGYTKEELLARTPLDLSIKDINALPIKDKIKGRKKV